MTDAPALSVVIASVNGRSMLEPTLDALDAQRERDRMEILVVDKVGGATREWLAGRAGVRLIPVDGAPGESIPRLRHRGVKASTGRLVAILEDHGEVAPGWAAALISAHGSGSWGAVGGVVENGRGGLVNWAAFLCEYTPYMAPLPEGEWRDLPGNNIAYRREDLLRHAGELEAGRWESWINAKLHAEGIKTAATNAAVVRHIKPFRLGGFLVQRFHFARSYAGMRRVDQGPAKRLVYGLGSAALPVLLSLRMARQALGKGFDRGRFLAVSPLVGLFFTVGAVGEMIGYLFGPGRSLSRVE